MLGLITAVFKSEMHKTHGTLLPGALSMHLPSKDNCNRNNKTNDGNNARYTVCKNVQITLPVIGIILKLQFNSIIETHINNNINRDKKVQNSPAINNNNIHGVHLVDVKANLHANDMHECRQ